MDSLCFDSESESSDDEFSAEEPTINFFEEASFEFSTIYADYLKDVNAFLSRHSAVNLSNALILNLEMQSSLEDVRKRVQSLLHKVKQQYDDNEKQLKENLSIRKSGIGVGIRGAYLKGGTFYFKGNMFFKDRNCRNCPNNADYEHRKNVEGEMFPMDFELTSRHVWSMVDKTSIVQAVKEQALEYLTDKRLRAVDRRKAELSLKISLHSEKLVDLLAKVGKDFKIDWEQVSAHNVNYRHSPTSCKAMWQLYLHPGLKCTQWTSEENQRLLESANTHLYQDWKSIAAEVGGRSDYQCFIQYETTVCYMDKQRFLRWDKRDDALLLQLVEKCTINGVINWNIVSSHFPSKPKSSIHQRYIYSLHPRISHEQFTAEEDLVLLAAAEEYGEKFASIPRSLFPNRSLTQLRVRYQTTLQNRHKITPWSVEDDKKLMEFVVEHGTSAWLKCAEMLGNHNRISCRTRFLTIQKFFQKKPDATLEDLPRKTKCAVKNSVITKQNWQEKLAQLRENPDTDLTPQKSRRRKEQAIKNKITKTKVKLGKVLNKKLTNFSKKTMNGEVLTLLQEAQVQRRQTRNRVYVERLRPVELKLYNFFKYSYNFRFGEDVCKHPPSSSLYIVSTALGFNATSGQKLLRSNILTPEVHGRCKYYLQRAAPKAYKQPFGHNLPPSKCTMTGLRALCLQSSQVNTQQNSSGLDSHSAIQLLRTRLHALFYKTALLSRISSNDFKSVLEKNKEGEMESGKLQENSNVKLEKIESEDSFEEQLTKRRRREKTSQIMGVKGINSMPETENIKIEAE